MTGDLIIRGAGDPTFGSTAMFPDKEPSSVFKQWVDTLLKRGIEKVEGNIIVDDTYFTMLAVPSQKSPSVEYRSSKYEVPVEPFFDGIIAWVTRAQTVKETRHLLSAYIPIAAAARSGG